MAEETPAAGTIHLENGTGLQVQVAAIDGGQVTYRLLNGPDTQQMPVQAFLTAYMPLAAAVAPSNDPFAAFPGAAQA